MDDIISGLIKKANLEEEEKAGPIHVYEGQGHKIWKGWPRDMSVVSITDYTNLYAERIPEEELAPEANYIHAFHFHPDPSKPHGVPFRFLIIDVRMPILTLRITSLT